MVAAVAALAVRRYSGYVLDDSFITFRFAENIAAGKGFTYNVGEKEFGTTAPLFTLVLAALAAVGVGTSPASLAIGVASFAGTVVLSARLAMRFGVREGVAFALGLALCAFPPLLKDAVSGMETSPVTCCTLLAIELCLAQRWLPFTAVGAVLALLRPDGVLVLVACGLYDLVAEKGSLRAWILRAAGVAGVLSAWFVFSYAYFGRFLPNSGFAKLLQGEDWGYFESHLLALLLHFAIVLPFVGLGLVHARRHARAAFLPAVFMAVYTAFFVGLRFPGCGWYMGPLHAPLLILAACGVETLLRAAPDATAWVHGVVLACAALTAPQALDDVRQIKRDQVWVDEHHAKVGRWLAANTPDDALVAADNIGYIGYLSGRRILDVTGLIQHEIMEGIRDTGNRRFAIESRVPPYIAVQDRGASPKYTPSAEWLAAQGYREVFTAPYSPTKAYRVWKRETR